MVLGLGEAITAISGAIAGLQSIAGEAWTRYFVILLIVAGDTLVGGLLGTIGINFYPIESLLSFVIGGLFSIPDFAFPVYYGFSSLLILVALMPFIFYLIKMAIS